MRRSFRASLRDTGRLGEATPRDKKGLEFPKSIEAGPGFNCELRRMLTPLTSNTQAILLLTAPVVAGDLQWPTANGCK